MATNQDRPHEVPVDDFDELFSKAFADSMGDEGDYQGVPVTNGRQAIEQFTGSFVDGMKSQLRDEGLQRRVIEGALPEGYTAAFDVVSQTRAAAQSWKQDFKDEVKPVLDKAKKTANLALPKMEGKLPPRVFDKIRKWAEGVDESQFMEKSQRERDGEDVRGVVDSVFGQYIADQEEKRTKEREHFEDVRQSLREIKEDRVSQTYNEHLAAIRSHGERMVNYQDQVTINFQRKMIDISYWGLITSRKQLDVLEQMRAMQTNAYQSIIKNTALPEVVKVHNTELLGQSIKEKFIGTVTDPMSRSFSTIGTKLMDRTKGKMREFASQLGTRVGNLNEILSQPGDMSAGDKVRTAGNTVGSGASHILAPLLGKFAGKGIKGNEKIQGISDLIMNTVDNAPQYYQQMVKANGSSGHWLLDMMRDFTDMNQDAWSRNRVVQSSAVKSLDDAAVFNMHARRTITDVIPGWLGRIHNELRMGRTGEEGDPDKFDFDTMRFESKKSMVDRYSKKAFSKNKTSHAYNRTFDMVDDLDPEGKLSREQRDALAKHITDISFEEDKHFSIQDLMSGKSPIEGEIGEEIGEILRGYTGVEKKTWDSMKDGKFTAKMKRELSINPKLQGMNRKATVGMQELRQVLNADSMQVALDLAKQGHLDVAEAMGLVTRSENEQQSRAYYNYDPIKSAVLGHADNVQDGQSPEERRARIEADRITSREYRNGRNGYWDEEKGKFVVVEEEEEANLSATDKRLRGIKDKVTTRAKGAWDKVTGAGRQTVSSVAGDLFSDSLSPRGELEERFGIAQGKMDKTRQRIIDMVTGSTASLRERIAVIRGVAEEEGTAQPNASTPSITPTPRRDKDQQSIQEIVEAVMTAEVETEEKTDVIKNLMSARNLAGRQLSARSANIRNRVKAALENRTDPTTEQTTLAQTQMVEATQTLQREVRQGASAIDDKGIDRLVEAIERNNSDEGFELLASQLGGLTEAVLNMQGGGEGATKGPGLIRRTARMGKAGLKGLWNYHMAVYKGMWKGAKFLAKAPKRMLDATQEAFGIGKYSAGGGTNFRALSAKDRTDEVKVDLYVEGQKTPVILATNMEVNSTTKYYSVLLDKDGNPSKRKAVSSVSQIHGPVYQYTVGNIENAKQIVSKDELPRLVLADGKSAKSLLSKAIKWSLYLAGGLAAGAAALAVLPPLLMAGGTAAAMWKVGKFVGRKAKEFLQKTPDIYVAGETTPRLLGRLMRAGTYINSTTKKTVKTIDDITANIVTSDGDTVLSVEDMNKGLVDVHGKPIKGPWQKVAGWAMNTIGLPIKLGIGAAKLTGKYLKASYKMMGKAALGLGKWVGGKAAGKVKDKVEVVKNGRKILSRLDKIYDLLAERLPGNKTKFGDTDGDGDRDGSREDILSRTKDVVEADREADVKEGEKKESKGILGLIMGAVTALGSGFAMIKNSFTKIFGFGRSISTMVTLLRTIAAGKAAGDLMGGVEGPDGKKGKGGGWRGKAGRVMSTVGGNKGKLAALALTGGAMYGMSGSSAEAAETDAEGNPVAASDDPVADKAAQDQVAEEKGSSWKDKAFNVASYIPGVGAVTDAIAGKDRGLVDYAFDAAAVGTAGKFVARQAGMAGLRAGAGAALTGLVGLVGAPVVIGVAAVAAVGALGYYLYKRSKDKKANAIVTFRMAQYGYNFTKESYTDPLLQLEKIALDSVRIQQGRATLGGLKLDKILELFKIDHKKNDQVKRFSAWFQYRFKPVFLGAVTSYHKLTGNTKLHDADKVLVKDQKIQYLNETHITEPDSNPYQVSPSPFAKDETVKYSPEDVEKAYKRAMKIVNGMKADSKKSDDVEDKTGETKDISEGSWMKSTANALKEGMKDKWKDIKEGASSISGWMGDVAKSVVTVAGNAKDAVTDTFSAAADGMAGGWDSMKHAMGFSSNQGDGEKAMLAVAKEAGITDPEELAALMATTAHESGNFRHTSENLNYSAATLMKLWPKRFPTRDKAAAVAGGGPEAVANTVYGGRMGNNANGDGWKYRGRGFIQLTGKSNYQAFAKATGIDVVSNPDLLTNPDMAAKSALHFWSTRKGLRQKAQNGDLAGVTKIVNGGSNGMADRQKKYANYLAQARAGKLGETASAKDGKDTNPASGGMGIMGTAKAPSASTPKNTPAGAAPAYLLKPSAAPKATSSGDTTNHLGNYVAAKSVTSMNPADYSSNQGNKVYDKSGKEIPSKDVVIDGGGGVNNGQSTGTGIKGMIIGCPMKDKYTLTSPHGYRTHPIQKTRKFHSGIDMAAPIGTKIYSPAAGTISFIGFQAKGAGKWIRINHGGGVESKMMHLNGYRQGLKVGEKVKAGQLVAYCGTTGGSTGPHLHWGLFNGKTSIDPAPYCKNKLQYSDVGEGAGVGNAQMINPTGGTDAESSNGLASDNAVPAASKSYTRPTGPTYTDKALEGYGKGLAAYRSGESAAGVATPDPAPEKANDKVMKVASSLLADGLKAPVAQKSPSSAATPAQSNMEDIAKTQVGAMMNPFGGKSITDNIVSTQHRKAADEASERNSNMSALLEQQLQVQQSMDRSLKGISKVLERMQQREQNATAKPAAVTPTQPVANPINTSSLPGPKINLSDPLNVRVF